MILFLCSKLQNRKIYFSNWELVEQSCQQNSDNLNELDELYQPSPWVLQNKVLENWELISVCCSPPSTHCRDWSCLLTTTYNYLLLINYFYYWPVSYIQGSNDCIWTFPNLLIINSCKIECSWNSILYSASWPMFASLT